MGGEHSPTFMGVAESPRAIPTMLGNLLVRRWLGEYGDGVVLIQSLLGSDHGRWLVGVGVLLPSHCEA